MAVNDDDVLELLDGRRRWWSEGEIVAALGADHGELAAALARLEATGKVSEARPLTPYDAPLWGIDLRGKP